MHKRGERQREGRTERERKEKRKEGGKSECLGRDLESNGHWSHALKEGLLWVGPAGQQGPGPHLPMRILQYGHLQQ